MGMIQAMTPRSFSPNVWERKQGDEQKRQGYNPPLSSDRRHVMTVWQGGVRAQVKPDLDNSHDDDQGQGQELPSCENVLNPGGPPHTGTVDPLDNTKSTLKEFALGLSQVESTQPNPPGDLEQKGQSDAPQTSPLVSMVPMLERPVSTQPEGGGVATLGSVIGWLGLLGRLSPSCLWKDQGTSPRPPQILLPSQSSKDVLDVGVITSRFGDGDPKLSVAQGSHSCDETSHNPDNESEAHRASVLQHTFRRDEDSRANDVPCMRHQVRGRGLRPRLTHAPGPAHSAPSSSRAHASHEPSRPLPASYLWLVLALLGIFPPFPALREENWMISLKPQEKIYFKSPVETALQYFSHISQVWSFQKKQTDLLLAFYKHRITKLEAALQEAQQTMTNQEIELSVLKKENGELKKCLAILKGSPNWYQGSRLATPRPVGITSPSQSVTPRPSSQHSSLVVRNPFTSFYSQPILQAFTCLFWTGDFFFQTIPKWWGFRPHKSPHPQQFRSEGKQNPTRESFWFPATSPADSLRTETDGISQVKRSMDYFQIDRLQVLYDHIIIIILVFLLLLLFILVIFWQFFLLLFLLFI
ncbi:hypothetical protein GH733_004101 [Mirounga leonina]|nr:hypothetical protein GH733_004101 [Mirounga leonina]